MNAPRWLRALRRVAIRGAMPVVTIAVAVWFVGLLGGNADLIVTGIITSSCAALAYAIAVRGDA